MNDTTAPASDAPDQGKLRVAVITPYYREKEAVLRQCHESVVEQTYPCTHYMVADGFPLDLVAQWQTEGTVEHITLPRAHRDNGNTPRAIGSLSAVNRDFDAITYLDADNWYRPNHIEALIELHRQSGAPICTTGRTIHRLDGSLMFVDRENDGEKHVDTSCILLTRKVFRLVSIWGLMPKQFGPHCDRVFWQAILTRQVPRAHLAEPTVAFRSNYRVHYDALGETPPQGAITLDDMEKPRQWWYALPESERQDWLRYFATGLW